MISKIKKHIVKISVIATMLTVGIVMMAYTKADNNESSESELISKKIAASIVQDSKAVKSIGDSSNIVKHQKDKAVNKVLNEEAKEVIELSDEKVENIEKSVEEVYYKNLDKNREYAKEKGLTDEELIEEQIQERKEMLMQGEYVAKTIVSIIDGEITVDDEHITELARKIKNMEDTDGSLMYQLYNAYKEYVYNNCDESVIKEVKEELQEELNEEKKAQ